MMHGYLPLIAVVAILSGLAFPPILPAQVAPAGLLSIGNSEVKIAYARIEGLGGFVPDRENPTLYRARTGIGPEITIHFFDPKLEIGQDEAFVAELRALSVKVGRMFSTVNGDYLFYELVRSEDGKAMTKYSVRGLLGSISLVMECFVPAERASPELRNEVEALFEKLLLGLSLKP